MVGLATVAVTATVSFSHENGRPSIDLSMKGVRVLYGLTIATSNYQFGSPLYGFYEPVLDVFYTKRIMTWQEVNALIGKARSIDPEILSDKQFHRGFKELGADDKGVILWYRAAFALFGPELASIYYVYFLLLAGSLSIYWLSFRDDDVALVLMALYPLVHLALTVFVLDSNPNVLGSLLGTRPFPMLAALPVLHLTLLMLRDRLPSRWLLVGAVVQVTFLMFIISVRSTAKVQILFIFLVAMFLFVRWLLRAKSGARWHRGMFRHAFLWIPAALLVGFVGAAGAYSAAVPSDIRARVTDGHLVWFSGLAGFVLNAQLHDDLYQFAIRHKPKGVDTGVYDAGGRLKNLPSLDGVAASATMSYAKEKRGEDIGDALFGNPRFQDFPRFERYARSLFFYELTRRPAEMARLYLIDKSINLFLIMKDALAQLQLYDLLMVATVLGWICGTAWLQGINTWLPLLAMGFAISSIPAYWFTPSMISMYDYAPYFYLMLLGAAATIGASVSSLVTRYALIARITTFSRAALPATTALAIPLVIASALTVGRLPGAANQSTLIIISATYGGNTGAPQGNATAKLRRACNGHLSCDYLIDVSVLGDPATGAGKDFTVEYECSHELKPIRLTIPAEAHGQSLGISCADSF